MLQNAILIAAVLLLLCSDIDSNQWQMSIKTLLSDSYINTVVVLLMTQVFLTVANSSTNNERELDEEYYWHQMEQLTDS